MVVDLRRALAIPLGGTLEPELTWLAENARGCETILELGSYHGRSTRAMLDNSVTTILCIDSWAGAARQGVMSGDEDLDMFLRNLEDVIDRVTALKMTTKEAVKYMSDPFDMIFIDASHDYEDVKFDIVHYAPFVRSGGLLCGHDFLSNREVTQAVRELIPDVKAAFPIKARRNIWWTRRDEQWQFTRQLTN